MTQRSETDEHPKKCPKCGHSPVATIQYGMPIMSPELQKALDEGRVVLGGCCIEPDSPGWACRVCNPEMFRSWMGDDLSDS